MAKTTLYKFDSIKMFNRATVADIDSYVLTAYFVAPSTICTSGRDVSRLKVEVSGTGLWLQNGPDPIKDSMQVPSYEETINSTKWVKGSCFPSMGKFLQKMKQNFTSCLYSSLSRRSLLV